MRTFPIFLCKDTIINFDVDAYVCPNNEDMLKNTGVAQTIYSNGGKLVLKDAMAWSRKNGKLKDGQVVTTQGGYLKAHTVIHTKPPIWNGGNEGEVESLKKCYKNVLLTAKKLKLKSIAIPNIATGNCGFPMDLAAQIAISTILDFYRAHRKFNLELTLCCYTEENYILYQRFLYSANKLLQENECIPLEN